jgi:cell division septation protein DedD
LPAPAESPASGPAPAEGTSLEQAAIVPASDDPPSPGTTGEPALRDTTVAEEPASASIYPELTEPLAYPAIVESQAQDQPGEPGEAAVADVPEAASQVEAATAVTEAESETEPEVAQTSDMPLPRAKPEPPVRTATAQAPQAQPEPKPQPSGSGPVQILPSSIASGQAPAQSRAVQQPATQPAARQRTIGRDYDPLAGQRPTYSGSSTVGPGAAVDQPAQPAPPQQVASIAPDAPPSQPQGLGGYVVQLASFRSEGEAQNDHQRLVQRHPQLVSGLESRIREASLGESGSFYRLSLGPLGDRSAATKLCNDLIAAGEKDCLVRRQ